MKTAEEWSYVIARLCDDSFCFDQAGAEEVIQQIQLEAMKEGMGRNVQWLRQRADNAVGYAKLTLSLATDELEQHIDKLTIDQL